MDAEPHGELDAIGVPTAYSTTYGLNNAEASMHRPVRIIFVGQGVAKVDQQAIAEILRDMALKAGDHLGAGVLVGPHHLAQVFWIELTGESGGVHQITEEDGELAAFGVGLAGAAAGGRLACRRHCWVAGWESRRSRSPVQTRTLPSSSPRGAGRR